MNEKRTMRLKLTKGESKLLSEIRGSSSPSDFIGYLIRSYKMDTYETKEIPLGDPRYNELQDQMMIDNLNLTINRIFHNIENEDLLKDNLGTSVSESVAEVEIKGEPYQVQVRLQSDRSAWIHPNANEIGVNKNIYADGLINSINN